MRRRAIFATAAFAVLGVFVASHALAQSQPRPGVQFPDFETMDKNKDGKVTREEFIASLPPEGRSVGARVFDARDTNKDGVITKDEADAARQPR